MRPGSNYVHMHTNLYFFSVSSKYVGLDKGSTTPPSRHQSYDLLLHVPWPLLTTFKTMGNL